MYTKFEGDIFLKGTSAPVNPGTAGEAGFDMQRMNNK